MSVCADVFIKSKVKINNISKTLSRGLHLFYNQGEPEIRKKQNMKMSFRLSTEGLSL